MENNTLLITQVPHTASFHAENPYNNLEEYIPSVIHSILRQMNSPRKEESTLICVSNEKGILLPKELPSFDDCPSLSKKARFSSHYWKHNLSKMKWRMKESRFSVGLQKTIQKQIHPSSLVRTKYIELASRMNHRIRAERESASSDWCALSVCFSLDSKG